ncbi:hypothetical protein ACQPZ2_43105 [Nocardia pseudovaccinii]
MAGDVAGRGHLFPAHLRRTLPGSADLGQQGGCQMHVGVEVAGRTRLIGF